ncbi:MAG TPA: flagellar basal-body rod protein FlgG [Chthonomonadaceae bacterium]|nr:flagellar basal-body rod protein FlgG [Chthonomonadaceae bacterium]
MLRSLFTSATGLAAQQLNLDVVANNLANASTVGFKRSRADFQDLVYQNLREPGAQTGTNSQLPTGSQVGLGVSTGTTAALFTQGTIQNTGGLYDLAIRGDGFFKVLLPDGTNAYTRAGNLAIDGTGKLVTPEGYPLQPEIVIPPNAGTSISISADGQVSVRLPGQSQAQTVGQIQLTSFINPAGLRALGGNLFQPTDASGQPTDGNPGSQGLGTLLHKSLEASNVDIVEEMVRMIILQRAYDTNSKVIQAADEMLNTTTNIKR